MTSAVKTTCPYCGVGCGVLATAADDRVEIAGDPQHPANHGRLCSKGAALAETVGLEGRLLYAQLHGQRASLDDALDYVAARFNRIIADHGAHALAFYVSGQLLTEDYYLANKLMKGFIGTANIDTNSRLCMSSSVAGHQRAFGEDVVPVCYDDIEYARLIVLVGSNTAWCHPVLFQRLTEAKERSDGVKIVVIDPRRTATCELADLHLMLNAGTDVWLFNGLLAYLARHGVVAQAFVEQHTVGVEDALRVATESSPSLEETASVCGISPADLETFYGLFARTEHTLTVYSQGVNQSTAGTDKVNSIINCHLLTGRIGRAGMGPFSITGQPNAMGGREVGGLATTLAAHLKLEDADHRSIAARYWNTPRVAERPGLKAVELFEAIESGAVKAVWIMATNPLVSLPDTERVKRALEGCELVVVSDCIERTDTNAFAHVLLPAAAWGEKDGTVTNSERRISRQRAFLPMPGDARADWWLIAEVAKRMGFEREFDFSSAREVFCEHAALSALANDDERAFNIGGLAALTREQYDALQPIQWPVPRAGHGGTARLMCDGRFYHPDGKARFVATPPRAPANATDRDYPLVLNTGRVRDQWHTMTRTGRAPRLTTHTPEPYIEMHSQDATAAGVTDDGLARVESHWGALTARVIVSHKVRRGMIFIPMHWSGQLSSHGRVGAAVNPAVDPVSGQPELKHTPVRVVPFHASWYGFVLVRRPPAALDAEWWTLVRGAQFLRYEIAGCDAPESWSSWARALLRIEDPEPHWLEYGDPAAGVFRAAILSNSRITGCVFIACTPRLPARNWLAGLFVRERISDAERRALLHGAPLNALDEAGPLVCSCFGVGRSKIAREIQQLGLQTPQEVGRKTRAGTNCGSCIPEIRALLAQVRSRSLAATREKG